MRSKFRTEMNNFFHDMTLAELRAQNFDYPSSKLTYNSMLYLDLITAHPGKYTASSIADILHVARPSVTQKLNELERMGYITKKQSETDKRVYYLYVSDNAFSDKLMQAYTQAENKVYERMTEQYTPQQINLFYKMLRTISKAFLNEIEDGLKFTE